MLVDFRVWYGAYCRVITRIFMELRNRTDALKEEEEGGT